MSETIDQYSNPLISRYASREMSFVFSDRHKFTTWRRLWCELAKAEQSIGISITDEQIAELERHVDDLDLQSAADYEKKLRHDVMAHIHAYGDQCPLARPIIHLGATSAYVGDNTDIIQIRDGLDLLRQKLLNLMRNLRDFSMEYRGLPTLGFTHFQPAQLTTVGKRAALWLQDFVTDFHDLEYIRQTLRFRGVKGTTGTQASFLSLFDGDHEKVRELDRKVSRAMGFDSAFSVTGQTYPRKLDSRVAALLSGVAQSISKMATDIRLLAHLKEIEEPFEASQVGSSAMPYKRNPMRSERMCALARFIVSLESSPAMTASTQWFERTLDDSANKRLTIPQMFLAADSILIIGINVTSGLVVYPNVIRKRIDEELPFIVTENILMQAVKNGGDRQTLHEEIRRLAQEAGNRIKRDGAPNDLVDHIRNSSAFSLTDEDLAHVLDPAQYVGRAPEQVEEFITAEVDPILDGETIAPVNSELHV